MACDLTTTLAAACTSGIGKLQSRIQLLQTWAQLVCSGGTPCVPLAAPVATAASSITANGFTANWTAVPGAVTYYLDVSTDPLFGSFLLGYNGLAVAAPSVSQAVVQFGMPTCYYRVRASALASGDLSCSSDNSNVITANPPVAFRSLVTFSDVTPAQTSFTTATYTPTANALVLAFIYANSSPTSVTGNGLTWVRMNGNGPGPISSSIQCSIYRAMGAAPTNTGLTVALTAGTTTGAIIHVQEYANVNTTGANGSGAVYQSGGISISDNITLSALNAGSLNAIVGTCVREITPTGAVLEGGWTQDVNQAQNALGTALGVFIAHRLATTDASFTSGMGSSAGTGSFALEIMSANSVAPAIVQPSAIANLEIWSSSDSGVYQDAAKTVPCTANGDLVYTWDNMGNTAVVADWIQATGADRPTYNATGGANGKPRISFNNNKLSVACGNFAQPFTSIFVATYAGSVGGAGVLLGDAIGLAGPSVIEPGALPYIYAIGAVVRGTIAVNTTPFLCIAFVNSTSSSLYTNIITNLMAGTVGATSFTSPFFMGRHAADAFYIIGDIYEQMFFSRILTVAEMCQIQIYVQNKYALSF